MGHLQLQDIQLQIKEPNEFTEDEAPTRNIIHGGSGRGGWQWWTMVALNIFFLLSGQTVATILGRLYYNKGGNSKWMSSLVQSVGFPILFIPYYYYYYCFIPASKTISSVSHAKMVAGIYVSIGILIAGDNLMYSYGLLYLPVSTYSLICASQLAFNAVFSYFINEQRFTPLVLNSIVLLTFAAALIGVHSEDTGDVHKGKYAIGFILTLAASAAYSLFLSLAQLTFQKVIKKESFSTVLEMQIWTSCVAAIVTVAGLFGSGEWKELTGEMKRYEQGRVSYVMTLACIAIAWQVASVGIIGLIFMVSSLFSNVISTMSLPIVPVFAVIFFHEKMDGVKIISMLISIWGFVSYIYQNYLDESRSIRKDIKDGDREVNGAGLLS